MLMMICLTVSVGARRLALSSALSSFLSGVGNSLYQTLVHTHLVLVPGLGPLTARRLAGDDVQGLGGQTDGALDLQRLGTRAVHQLLAHLLERGNLARGERDADLVDLLFFI